MAQSAQEMQLMRLYFPEKDLVVVSATRSAQPISKTAENVTVITADEIRNMNAHTVADVLYRIPGLFINYYKEMGAPSTIAIQGADYQHTLVLLDGIEWNFLSSGVAEASTIPVGIIDRIEVIQGPASSAWGSSLGGVVNIITKSAGTKPAPTGSASLSVGESGALDYSGQVAGKTGPLGYYLYAGAQKADGIENGRGFDNKSVFSKIQLPFSDTAGLSLSAGYSNPDSDQGVIRQGPLAYTSETDLASWHVDAALNGNLTDRLKYKLSAYYLRQTADNKSTSLGNLGLDAPGDLFSSGGYIEKTLGGSAKLVWKGAGQVVVLGSDYHSGKLDQTQKAGPLVQQLFGAPAVLETTPSLEKWAIFLNDAISIHGLTITPGIRLDHNSLTGSFFSPSLGVAYQMKDETILRATIARGFTYPRLSYLSGGAVSVDPNPDLKPETVWSYQAGVETESIPGLWMRLDVFYDHQTDAFETVPHEGFPGRSITINSTGTTDRMGAELLSRTRPFHHFSLMAGGLYVDLDHKNDNGSNQMVSATFGLEYNNPALFYVQFFGRYEQWDAADQYHSNDRDMIWELNIHRKLFRYKQFKSQVFFTVHNLFSGSQYLVSVFPNPPRWIEGGLRFFF